MLANIEFLARVNKRILIIENDRDIREVINLIISEQGHDVINYDGRLTGEIATFCPDLILLDEWIDEQNGGSLCIEIKKVHSLVQVPVVLLSTRVDIEEFARRCDADGYLAKPFDVDNLIFQINVMLFRPK